MKYIIYGLITILTSLALGFCFLFYPHIEVTKLTYSDGECKVIHSIPTKFQISQVGIQQNTLEINNCKEASIDILSGLYNDLSLESNEAYTVEVNAQLRQHYQDLHFFYFKDVSFTSVTDIIENNTFVFNLLEHEYTSSFELIKPVNHKIFLDKQDEIQKEILVIIRLRSNDNIEISYKYNNNKESEENVVHEVLKGMLGNSTYQSIQ